MAWPKMARDGFSYARNSSVAEDGPKMDHNALRMAPHGP